LAVGALLFTCGCERKIDQKKLDKLIKDMFSEQLELEVTDIDCPKDIKVEEGKDFECTVSVEPKGKVPVVVEMTDGDGSINAETKYDVINPKKLNKLLKNGLRAKGIDAKVDCGKKIRLAKPDSDFTCKASDGKIEKKVRVSIDDDGKVSWKTE